MNYDNNAEAQTKLSNSLIMYKGEPFFVAECSAKTVSGWPLPLARERAEVVRIPMTDPSLTYSKMRLGYINFESGGAAFLARSSLRRNRQGLCSDNVVSVNNNEVQFNFGNELYKDSLKNTLLGKYPSFEEALDRVASEKKKRQPNGLVAVPSYSTGVAFNKQLAIRRKDLNLFFLMYKGHAIDVSVGVPKAFTLPEEYTHLREVVAEAGVPLK